MPYLPSIQRVGVTSRPLVCFVLGIPEFKTSPTLGNSQLAASCQLGFFIMLCSIWIIRF